MRRQAELVGTLAIASIIFSPLASVPQNASAYTPHDPISINGNENFTAGNGVTGGNGTIGNPYRIENWDINASTADGIVIRNTTAHFVIRNISLHSGSPAHKGLFIMNVTNGTIHNVTAVYNSIGMSIDLSTTVTISSSHINNNTLGMRMNWSDNSTILGTEFRNNTWLSLSLINSSHNDIVSSIFSGNESGISLILSHNNRIDGNEISWNDFVGIYCESSSWNTVINNTFHNNSYGFLTGRFPGGYSENNTLTLNTFYANDCYGVSFEDSMNNTASFNDFIWNDIGVKVEESTDGRVVGNNFSYNRYGAYIMWGEDSLLEANTFRSDRDTSIIIHQNPLSTVTRNTVRDSPKGIVLYKSPNTTLAQNDVVSDNVSIQLRFTTDVLVTSNNVFSRFDSGIHFLGSEECVAKLNIVSDSSVGIDLEDSVNNSVYHNKIMNNAIQATDNALSNLWDDGYPRGGNYWSDYSGNDLFNGPNQDVLGPDTIGDSRYDISSNVSDRYPLMISPDAMRPLPPRDPSIALTGLDYENITLEWNLSLDDSFGHQSVVRYGIYRSPAYRSDLQGYSIVGSVSHQNSTLVDAYAGEGDDSNHFYAVCAVDFLNNSTCAQGQVGKFTRSLSPGPILVSLPLIQSNESIETVLQTVQYDKAWFYDSSSQEWKWYMKSKTYRRGLWNVNHTMGLWVNVTQNSNLTVAGTVPAQTTIHLHEGWNLVSFPSVNTSFTVADLKASSPVERVEGFDSSPPHLLRVLTDSDALLAGRAYWVRVQADVVWNVAFE